MQYPAVPSLREHGLRIGGLEPGPANSIADAGVKSRQRAGRGATA